MNAGGGSGAIRFQLNGREVAISGGSPRATLLDCVRAEGLTGAKEGCAEGECGACSVLLVAPRGDASAFRTANSCLMLLPMAAGHEVYTVESLAQEGNLCEAQEAMAAAGGSQCGYCTPGFVMSLFAEQYRPDRSGPCDPHELSGNLCRCTGYRPISAAAKSLGPPPPGAFLDRLMRPAKPIESLSYESASMRFSRPATVEDCVAALEADPQGKLVAGGTDLVVESNLRGKQWPHLISLDAIPELRGFESDGDGVRIGAALPLTDVLSLWTDAPAALRECLELFASTTIRNRATLGGNLANAAPIGDSAPLLLALAAVIEIAGPKGRRTLPLAAFFTGYRRTALGPAEMLTAIRVPKPFPQYVRFLKVSKRRVDDISTVSAGMSISADADGIVVQARFAFGGVAATPLRVLEAEECVAGRVWDLDAVRRVQAVIARAVKPIGDHRGSANYRLAITQSLVEKFWVETGREAYA
jgi:xanthine dehydrogenase small subunit